MSNADPRQNFTGTELEQTRKTCKNLFAQHLATFKVLISANLGDVGIATLLMRLEMEDGGSVFDGVYGLYRFA